MPLLEPASWGRECCVNHGKPKAPCLAGARSGAQELSSAASTPALFLLCNTSMATILHMLDGPMYMTCRPELPYVASMRKGDPAAVTVGAAIQELWLAGAPLMWPAPTPGSSPEYCAPNPCTVLLPIGHALG